MRVLAVMLFGLAAASCGPLNPPIPDPTQADLVEGVSRSLQALHVVAKYRVPELPPRCEAGVMGEGVEVRTCTVCAITIYRGNLYSREPVTVRREEFSILFRRALSYDQPEVMPVDPESGVWAPSIPPAQGYSPPPIIRNELNNMTLHPNYLGQLIGLDVSQGFTGEYFYGTATPEAVWQSVLSLPDSEIEALVGPCQ